MLWMLAAILICGASVFTACSSNDDNPFQPVVQVGIDKTNFPDDNFWNYLLEQDYGKDGVLTEAEIRNITVMDVSEKEIKSLKGIEYFTALRTLNCSDNELTELDISGNTALDTLDCGFNELTSLDLSKNMALEKLLCFKNQISGQNMDALIGSLRQNESEEFCAFYVMDGNEPNQNVCTKSQAAAAKAKGWLPKYWDEDEKAWLEYEGSEPIREKK